MRRVKIAYAFARAVFAELDSDIMWRAKGSCFDNFSAIAQMHDLKPTPDNAGVAK